MSESLVQPASKIEDIDLSKTIQLVVFKLKGEAFAAPIRQVVEIIKPQKVTRMPRAPHYVDGILNLRGQVFPVVNLHRRLSLGESEVTSKSRIMVAEVSGEPMGLVVDEVEQVLRVPEDDVDEAPELMEETTGKYISGVVRIEDRMILQLDLDSLFLAEEFVELNKDDQGSASDE